MRAEYDAWAAYYDWLHPGLPGEAEFYLREGLASQGPILELGVGTGRVAIPLALSGKKVFGVDLSADMLTLCAEKRRIARVDPALLPLVQADMRSFAFSQPFESIIMPYRAFMHLLTEEEQVACLCCVRDQLAGGGRFVMNLWAVRLAQLAKALGSAPGRFKLVGRHVIAEEELELRHAYRAWFVPGTRWLEEEHRVTEVDLRGKLLRSTVLTMRRACITAPHLRRLLPRCGLKVAGLLGGFSGEPFQADSHEMIWILERA